MRETRPNQVACCQREIVEAPWGSNGARFLSTPPQRMTNLRRHAPTACIVGLPAARAGVAAMRASAAGA